MIQLMFYTYNLTKTHFYDDEKYMTDTHGTAANKKCFEHFHFHPSSVKQAAGSSSGSA